MKKRIIPALIITMAAAAAFYSASGVSAHDQGEQYPTVVQKIADKFGLKVEDVKAVFDESRTELTKDREAKFEARLSALVTSGKLTEAQKQLILTKHKELESKRESQKEAFKAMTAEERKVAMQKEKDELTTWASQNHIDVKLIIGFGGVGVRGHGPKLK